MAAWPPSNRPVFGTYERHAKQTFDLAIRHPSGRRHAAGVAGGVARPWIPTRQQAGRPADGMRLLGSVDGRGNVLSVKDERRTAPGGSLGAFHPAPELTKRYFSNSSFELTHIPRLTP